METEWMVPKQVAVLLLISPRTAARWVREGRFGEGSAMKLSPGRRGEWRVLRSAVLTFIARSQAAANRGQKK